MPDKILDIQKDTQKADLDRFADLLVQEGAIKQDDLSNIKEKYSSVSDAIKGLLLTGVDHEVVAKAYGKYANIPYIELDYIDDQVDQIIEPGVAKRFGFIPFSYDQSSKILQAAFFDIEKLIELDRQAIEALQET